MSQAFTYRGTKFIKMINMIWLNAELPIGFSMLLEIYVMIPHNAILTINFHYDALCLDLFSFMLNCAYSFEWTYSVNALIRTLQVMQAIFSVVIHCQQGHLHLLVPHVSVLDEKNGVLHLLSRRATTAAHGMTFMLLYSTMKPCFHAF